VTLATPRTDDPLAGIKVPATKFMPSLPAGPDHLEIVLAEAAERLPVAEAGDAGHEHILPSFTSGQEAVDYARRRYREYAEAVSRRQG
jgi:phospholipase C